MLYYFLIILFYLCFLYFAQKNVKNGLYLVCALLPTYLIRFSVFGIPATLLEGMIIILFIIWLIKEKISLNPLIWLKNLKNKNEEKNAIPKLLRWPIILLLIASTISVFVSPDLRNALGIWKAYFIEPIMFLLIFVYNIKTSAEIKNVIKALGVTALAIGIFAVIQALTGALIPNAFWAAEATRRITTFFGYPNANGLFLIPIVFLTLGSLATEKKLIWQIISRLVVTLSVIAIICTHSTGAVLGLVAGLLAIVLFYKKTRLPVLISCFFVLLIFTFSPAIQNKISNSLFLASQTRLPLVPTDLQIRSQIGRETLTMLSARPIFGAGLAGYQTAVAPYHVNKHIEIFLYPHDFFLNFWTETGLLGLLAIIWLLAGFFRLAAKNPNILTFSAIWAIIALLVHGLVDVPYFKNDLAILFWIIIGIVIILNNKEMCQSG
ncbi:MAG: O-antigen ligase family protein [Candidatus Komeilibacteria bacterium]|nr:O-antigen ligase family protein [Candidatus Komeilibacteria bacterium]